MVRLAQEALTLGVTIVVSRLATFPTFPPDSSPSGSSPNRSRAHWASDLEDPRSWPIGRNTRFPDLPFLRSLDRAEQRLRDQGLRHSLIVALLVSYLGLLVFGAVAAVAFTIAWVSIHFG